MVQSWLILWKVGPIFQEFLKQTFLEKGFKFASLLQPANICYSKTLPTKSFISRRSFSCASMASESNVSGSASATPSFDSELVTVTMGGVSCLVPRAFAEALSSKSGTLEVQVSTEKFSSSSEQLVKEVAHVADENPKSVAADSVTVTADLAKIVMAEGEVVSGDVEVNPEGVNAGEKDLVQETQVTEVHEKSSGEFLFGFSLEELNSAKLVRPEEVDEGNGSPARSSEDPAKGRTAEEGAVNAEVSQSEDTVVAFGGTMSEILASKKSGESFVDPDEALEALEKLKEVAQFDEVKKESSVKDSEGDNDDVQIVETSSSASKKKAPKPTSQRKQPSRAGKRKVEIEDETELDTPKTSGKKPRIPKSIVSGKEVLMEMECSAKFLRDEGFSRVLELLEFQGWENLCSEKEQVCHEVVNDFFKNLTLENGPIPVLNVNFRGKKFRISSGDLSAILDIPHSGYAEFNKGNIWPKVADSKEELVKKICGISTVPGEPIKTTCMEPNVKMLHKLLTSNFIQRGTKVSYCQHEDLILLDKILRKEKVNLPKLMIYQLHHMSKLTQVGYSRVIKKILEVNKLYKIKTEAESPVVRKFDSEQFRKMGLIKDSETGMWVRASAELEAEEKDEVAEEQIELSGSEIAMKLKSIEQNQAELKSLVKTLLDKF